MRPLFFALFAGCSAGASDPEATLDIKVDHNNKDDAVESIAPRGCFAAGHLYAVWQDDRDGTPGVWFNASVDAGATWMTADVELSGDAGAYAPDIACARDTVYVVWEDERDGDLLYRNIYANVSTNGGRDWKVEAIPLDGDPDGDAMSLGPRLAVVEDAAYVAWFDNRDGAYDIYLQATPDQGESWLAAPTRVDSDTAGESYSAWPRLAANADRVVVAWEDSRAGATDIYANVSDPTGEAFGADARLDRGDEAGEHNSFVPSIAMVDDAVYVAWHDERNGENRDVFLNVSTDGASSWLDDPKRADSDAAGQADSINPQVAAIGDRVHVVWQDDRAGGYDVMHRRSTDRGASWAVGENRMDTDTAGESQSYDPVLSVRADNVLVGWQERRADANNVGFNDLYYNYSANAGADWAAEDLRINSNAPGTAYAVDLSLLPAGDGLIAVWADGRFGSSDIFSANRVLGAESVYIEPEEDEDGKIDEYQAQE